jgi:hypothetical protein
MRVLNEYNLPAQHNSTHLNNYDSQSHQNLSEHIPSNMQHLFTGSRPNSNMDQLTNVSRASNTPAYRQDRVLSGPSPTIIPIQRSYSKNSNHSSKHYTPHHSPTRSHTDDIY